MKVMITTYSRWNYETYKKSEHPEWVAIRNIVSQNPQHSFILFGEGGSKYEHFGENGIHFYNISSNTKIRYIFSFFLKFELSLVLKPSVIVSMGATNLIPFGISSILTGARFIPDFTGEIWYDRSQMPRPLRKIWAFLLKAVFQRSWAILAISPGIKREIENDYRISSSKVFTYKYKVSSIFNPHVSKDLKLILNPAGRIVLTVSRIHPQKGLEYLIEASRTIVGKIPDVKVVIQSHSSDERYEEKLLRMIRKYDLQDHITILKKRVPYSEMPKYMSAADVFVLPSTTEGLGLVILEALASGVPVVASKVGGIADTLINGYNGLLVAPKDIKGLAEAIVMILSDDEMKKRLVEGGLSTIRNIEENEIEKLLNEFIFKD